MINLKVKNIKSKWSYYLLKPKIFVCNVDEASVQNGNNYTEIFY